MWIPLEAQLTINQLYNYNINCIIINYNCIIINSNCININIQLIVINRSNLKGFLSYLIESILNICRWSSCTFLILELKLWKNLSLLNTMQKTLRLMEFDAVLVFILGLFELFVFKAYLSKCTCSTHFIINVAVRIRLMLK